MSETYRCRATTLPCCFSCPAPVCALVDVHGALDADTYPHPAPQRADSRPWWRRLWR